MSENTDMVQVLRELGLTRTEAEVYLATLHASAGRPVSGYRVAQDMGRDPANLAKTLSSLKRAGAVRVVQEKPRLYLPTPPRQFTDGVLARVRDSGDRAAALLDRMDAEPAAGLPLALPTAQQVLKTAATLLNSAGEEALLFCPLAVCSELAAPLRNVAHNNEIRLRILTDGPLKLRGSEIAARIKTRPTEHGNWLQLVTDRRRWLVAVLPAAGSLEKRCGWWGEDANVGRVLAASLAAGMEAAAAAAADTNTESETHPATEVETITPVAAAPPTPEQTFEPLAAAAAAGKMEPDFPIPPTPAREPATTPEAKDEDDEGIQFIIRHDEDS